MAYAKRHSRRACRRVRDVKREDHAQVNGRPQEMPETDAGRPNRDNHLHNWKRKILVSACLLGHNVRYDQGDNTCTDPRFQKWREEGRFVAVCPEVAGGLPTPRPPAEIRGDRVVNVQGADVTEFFCKGAEAALALAKAHNVAMAILKERSPSCGSAWIYDGTFSGRKIPGEGVAAALLRRHGIPVFSEEQLDEAEAWLAQMEGEA